MSFLIIFIKRFFALMLYWWKKFPNFLAPKSREFFPHYGAHGPSARSPLTTRMGRGYLYIRSTFLYPSGFRHRTVYGGLVLWLRTRLAKDCWETDGRSSFYTCFTAEVEELGALSPGSFNTFWSISASSWLNELSRVLLFSIISGWKRKF